MASSFVEHPVVCPLYLPTTGERIIVYRLCPIFALRYLVVAMVDEPELVSGSCTREVFVQRPPGFVFYAVASLN